MRFELPALRPRPVSLSATSNTAEGTTHA
jgi:hypothetical protein